VNVAPVRYWPLACALFAAALVLTATAWQRSAEYDEQYTLFLTGSSARPAWTVAPITAGDVVALQVPHASLGTIVRDLRRTDVHPPLYFWATAAWRRVAGSSLVAARMLSVLFSIASLVLVAVIARLAAIPCVPAALLTLGCYGFSYTGTIARGFALAQMLTVAGVAALLLAERRAGRVLAVAAGMALGAATFSNYLAAFVACAVMAAFVVASVRRVGAVARVAPVPGVPPVPSVAPLAAVATLPRVAPVPSVAPLAPVAPLPRVAPVPSVMVALGATTHDLAQAKKVLGGRTKCNHDAQKWRRDAFIAFAIWLPADAWLWLAQRESRTGQFAPFEPASTTFRLATYAAANVFGGLPLYVPGTAQTAVAAILALFLLILVAVVILRWRQIATPELRLFAMAAVAPPLGLLLLGAAFDNTPIELRYLAFSTPFIGLLLAAALPRSLRHLTLAIQVLALAGLMLRPETMQPARATAIAAASLVQDGVVLLPRGNDGVGIVGAFAIEAPPAMRLLVIDRDSGEVQIRARADHFRRVVLALLAQDDASRATLAAMRQAFADPCWRTVGEGQNVLAFQRICGE
jgi:hypothetical protein